uniref:CRAL-TRIO domain-containing protein n=1 Tax=Plectus sambesii TaxID=2011161 RepID=A0A914WB03_9BILA
MTWQQYLSSEELRGIQEIRQTLANSIPADLDTDFNLARWWRAYHGDVKKIAEVIPMYDASRRAAGFVGDNFIERYFELPSIKPYLPFIASSRLYDKAWSENRSAFLFVEKAWSQPKEFIKVLKTSDYLLHCFGYSEYLMQLILRKEKQIKRPVRVITIFDLGEMSVSDYLNPLSPYFKLWKLRSDIWQDWYPDMVQKIIIVNPPRLVGTLWGLVKLFLNEHNRSLLMIVSSHREIEKYIDSHLIPVAYGGKFKENDPITDDSCCSKRKKITPADYYQNNEHYMKKLGERPPTKHHDFAPATKLAVGVNVSEGQSLLWDFYVNSEVEFSIRLVRKDESDLLIFPKLKLVTSKLREEGIIEKPLPGEYIFDFTNTSNYFHAKMDYCFVAA